MLNKWFIKLKNLFRSPEITEDPVEGTGVIVETVTRPDLELPSEYASAHLIPKLRDLPAKPRRIILHWTAGTYKPNQVELSRYMYLADGDGAIHAGVPVVNNMRQLARNLPTSEYAAHTGGMNSYSVGFTFCGMRGAHEWGPYGNFPLKRDQVLKGCEFVAHLCKEWELYADKTTVFTHWEAEHLHGVRQKGKWDITVLTFEPDIQRDHVGPWLRDRIRGYYNKI